MKKISLYKLASGKLSIIQLVYSSLDIVHNLWASKTSAQLKNLVSLTPLETENYFLFILELCKTCFNPHQSMSILCLNIHLHGCRYFIMRTGFKCFQPLGTGTKSLRIMPYLCHWQFLRNADIFKKQSCRLGVKLPCVYVLVYPKYNRVN